MNIYHRLKALLFMAGGALLLSACASSGKDPLVGASWVAVQDITFPPRQTTIFIQDGSILERSNRRDQFAPHCSVGTASAQDEPFKIKKGVGFKILGVGYPSRPVNVTTTMRETRMRVEATNYPDISAITCSIWTSQDRRHMSTEAMQNTMKGLFALEL
jgi:hypothetical protein